MTIADCVILLVLALAVLGGLRRGFFVTVCSLAGVLLGLILAGRYYQKLDPFLGKFLSPVPCRITGFLVVALATMVLGGLMGRMLRSLSRFVGLGWADRLAGGLLGLFKGGVVVAVLLMAITAFVPRPEWLKQSRLAPRFLKWAYIGAGVVPLQLSEQIRAGVHMVQAAPFSFGWSNNGKDGR